MLRIDQIILPNKPLTNHEIHQAITDLNIQHFRGVFSRDNLPHTSKAEECGVLNLDDRTGNGTHWVAWFKQNNKCIYFDSFGIEPPLELSSYLNHPKIQYNSRQIQRVIDVICGHLCLYVLNELSKGKTFIHILISLY